MPSRHARRRDAAAQEALAPEFDDVQVRQRRDAAGAAPQRERRRAVVLRWLPRRGEGLHGCLTFGSVAALRLHVAVGSCIWRQGGCDCSLRRRVGSRMRAKGFTAGLAREGRTSRTARRSDVK